MKRLTERDEYGNGEIIALSGATPTLYDGLDFNETNALTEALNKLADYEEAEETGRLIRLPCKPGDMAYYIRGGYVVGETVLKVVIDDTGIWVQVGPHRQFRLSEFGRTVFTTVDEAEKALKEAGSCATT